MEDKQHSKEKTYWDNNLRVLQGATVVQAGAIDEEMGAYPFLVLRGLKGGLYQIEITMDAEDNGPGFIHVESITEEEEL